MKSLRLATTRCAPPMCPTPVLLLLVLGAVWCGFAASAFAQTSATIVRVEEDWELEIKTPDENSAGPQVVSTISPLDHVEWFHATLELNHQSLPSFVPGGMQLQTWEGESPVDSRKFPSPQLLHHADEMIRWTQSMRLSNGSLLFEITDGTSDSWGDFGGQGYLKWSAVTDLENLNGYDRSVSVDNSGVSYGKNLVDSLVLKRVRLVDSDGQVTELSDAITVYSDN